MRYKLQLIFVSVLLVLSGYAMAQDATDGSDNPEANAENEVKEFTLNIITKDGRDIRDPLEDDNLKTRKVTNSINSSDEVAYIPASHANLSMLLWKYNMYDSADDEIIDDYVHAANCQMYEKYRKNEFIWENIRKGAKRQINYFAVDYPDRFELVTYVGIGTYDFGAMAFKINDRFMLDNNGALVFPFEKYKSLGCQYDRFTDYFTENMKFIPDNKFNLTHVPIPPEEADNLIDRILKYSYNGSRNQRFLTMKIRLKINGIEDLNTNKSQSKVIFTGQLDEVILYEDPDMTIPVWKKSFVDLK